MEIYLYSLESRALISDDCFTKKLKERVVCAEKVIEIMNPILEEDEREKFALLLGNIILNPIYRMKYKSHLPDKYNEYNFLSKQQISNRRKKEVYMDPWEEM